MSLAASIRAHGDFTPMTARRSGSFSRRRSARFRVVRLLPLRLAGDHHRDAVLLRPFRRRRLHLRPARVRRRLRRAAVRRAGVRPARRPGRPQVHVPGHDPDHGPVDFLVGLLPSYATIGIAAPYSARRCACCRAWRSAASTAAPPPTSPNMRRRDGVASTPRWIQTTATLGLFLSLLVIWRHARASARRPSRPGAGGIPFLVSIVLLAISRVDPPAAATNRRPSSR